MPIYEYECAKCSTIFEVMQAISAKPLKTCQSDGCRGKVRRLISSTGFILKGDGWYTSDYPSEARKKGWEQENKQANAGKPEPSAKGDKAAAPAKAEAKPTKSVEKKPSQKNPYSGKSQKKSNSSK